MTGRRRRTAEESRANILDVAAKRLHDHGLEGLNITGVAEEAGISHATLIHHFGSSGGMRDALADKMTADLIQDLMAAFDAHVPTSQLTRNVFSNLAEGGHAKLVAWRSLESGDEATDDSNSQGTRDLSDTQALFQKLLARAQSALEVKDSAEVRKVVFLVAIAAIGYGIAGPVLAQVLGIEEDELNHFPEWLTEHLRFNK